MSVSVVKEGRLSAIMGHHLMLVVNRFSLAFTPLRPNASGTGGSSVAIAPPSVVGGANEALVRSIAARVRSAKFDVASISVGGSLQDPTVPNHSLARVFPMSESDHGAILGQVFDKDMLFSKQHPVISFNADTKATAAAASALRSIAVPENSVSKPTIHELSDALIGDLTIKGQTQRVSCSAQLVHDAQVSTRSFGDDTWVMFRCPVETGKFGVAAASAVVGALRTCPTVQVEVAVPIKAMD